MRTTAIEEINRARTVAELERINSSPPGLEQFNNYVNSHFPHDYQGRGYLSSFGQALLLLIV